MIVLDTHIWHWWTNQIPGHLSPSLLARIENADRIGVSTISCFEMAWLVHHNRIDLGLCMDEWFAEVEASGTVEFLPVTSAIARQAVVLPEHHKDPQDRLIIATALAYDAQVISLDAQFLAYRELQGRLIGNE
jgi:PIN domain nuclease of toxin-antitoxin system